MWKYSKIGEEQKRFWHRIEILEPVKPTRREEYTGNDDRDACGPGSSCESYSTTRNSDREIRLPE